MCAQEQREKAQATAARMEPLSKVPTQTTQVIPPVQQQLQSAAPSASDDLLSLDANPFPSSILQSNAAPANNNQWMMNQQPPRKYQCSSVWFFMFCFFCSCVTLYRNKLPLYVRLKSQQDFVRLSSQIM